MFKKDGKSFNFCLVSLSDTERAEISRLITENGGEICDTGSPPVITFTSRNNHTGEVVLHLNYIRECIRHGNLLDPSNFNAENSETKIKENDMFLLVNNHFRIQAEHSYAREYFNKHSTNTCFDKDFCDIERENTDSHEKSLPMNPVGITIICRWVGEMRNNRLTAKQTSPNVKLKETNPPNAVNKEAENSLHQTFLETKKSFDQKEHMSLWERQHELKSLQIIIPDPDISPKSGLRMLKRAAPMQKKVVNDDGGETKQTLQSMKEFRLTSSDSNDMDCNPSTAVIDCEHRRSVNQSSSFRLKEAASAKKRFKKDRDTSSPSRESNDSDNAEEIEGTNDEQRSRGQSNSAKQSDKMNHTLCTRRNRSRVSYDERNTMISSPGSSISRNDSSSEEELTHSRPKVTLDWMERQNLNQEKKKHGCALTRNFSRWEQREMVKYLIDNNCISYAKGNRVWN